MAQPKRGKHAPSPLVVSVAGVRGIVGESLTPEVVARYVTAYAGTLKGGDVLVAGDSRASRAWIAPIVAGALSAAGLRPFLADLLPTPTVGLVVRTFGMAGGIAITASHNPVEYNGLKFFTSAGIFQGPAEHERMKSLLGAGFRARDSYESVWTLDPGKLLEAHMEAMAEVLEPFEGRTRVVIDCCNGAGAVLAPLAARSYGAAPTTIHERTTVPFERGAEPLPENLKALCREVVARKAAVGFALDPDGDRLALVDETGRAIGEERTLVLAADAWLRLKGRTPLVANLSSSRALEDVASAHRTVVHRSKVGEAHVVAMMKAKRAAVGGEGNGGIIVPAIHPGRDAATGIALILTGLRRSGFTNLSEWNASIPDYAIVKGSTKIMGIETARIFSAIQRACRGAQFDLRDGLKATWPDRWLHVRASGTEPILRMFAEAPSRRLARDLIRIAERALP